MQGWSPSCRMGSSNILWCGNCSCSWHASCSSFSLYQRLASVGFPRSFVNRKQFCGVSRGAATRRVRSCTVSASEELQEKFCDEAGALGAIALSPQDGSSVVECNGIVKSSSTGNTDSSNSSYGELLSRCTSVAERSAIALATMAYERAKRLFNVVSVNLTDLETNFRQQSKAFGFLSSSDSETIDEDTDSGFKALHERVLRLEEELNDKDQKLQLALVEANNAYDQLAAVQNSPRPMHDVDVIFEDPAAEISLVHHVEEAEMRSQEEFHAVEAKVTGLLEKVHRMNGLLAGWKNALTVLQLESQHSSEALQSSVQELVNAQAHIQSLKTLSENQEGEIAAKNEQLSALQGELSMMRRELENVSKSLAAADQQRKSFENHIKNLEEALQHEKETIAAVIRSSSSQKDALAAADKKVASLTSEVSSLKSLVDGKEELISAMRDEARRNANMLVSAAKTREALLIAEKRIEQLNNQVSALEEEVKSRDLVLNEIKEEAVQSTEALRLAAQIKQDLNLSRQKELELSQELESMKEVVKDLRHEVVENNRAVRAEQALRQLESEMDELTAEVDILRKGVEARDEAIQLMKEEVDRNIDVLSHAAGNRELVRELEEHIEELKVELRKKDTMLAAMNKSLDVSPGYKSSSSSSYEDSTSYNLPPSSSSTSSQSFGSEEPKSRKRVTRNTSGGGYKRSPRHST